MFDLERYRENFNKSDMFSIASGMRLVGISEGYAKVELVVDENSKNYIGSMHGGLLYTMADVAAGTAMVSYGKQGVTLSAFIDYIRPVFSGRIIAEGRVVSHGKTVSRCEVEIHGEDGTLYCRSNITMFNTGEDVQFEKNL